MLDKAQSIINVETCGVDSLADSKYFMGRWPTTSKTTGILYII
jgi:hypothetical protein